jgi:hypothetical protein
VCVCVCMCVCVCVCVDVSTLAVDLNVDLFNIFQVRLQSKRLFLIWKMRQILIGFRLLFSIFTFAGMYLDLIFSRLFVFPNYCIQSCFKLKTYENDLLRTPKKKTVKQYLHRKQHVDDSSETEIRHWFELTKRLCQSLPAVWISLLNCIVARLVDCLAIVDDGNVISMFMCGECVIVQNLLFCCNF